MRAVQWAGIAVLVASGAGCASSAEKDERLGQHVEQVVAPQMLTLALPKGALLQQQALVSAEQMSIAPNVKLLPSSSGFAEVSSLGLTNLGADAAVRSIWSQGKVSLADRAKVDGFIKTTVAPTQHTGVVITGPVDTAAALTPPLELKLSVTFPGGSPVMVEPGQQQPLSPGAYGQVSLKSTARLNLSAGTYVLTGLSTEPNSVLTVDTRNGPVLVYTQTDLTLKGRVAYVGDASSLLFVQAGTNTVNLESALTGSVFAPHATLRLAPVAAPGFRGSFFGKRVSVEAWNTVTFDPFAHWGAVFPPVPLVNCVSQVSPGAYAALFGYDNPLGFDVTVPVGPGNSLSPVPVPAASLPTVFQPGRHPIALWAPIGSAPLTWNLGGASATASPSSAPCSPDAYPPVSPEGQPRGDHPSPPLGLTRKPSSYFDPPASSPPPAPLVLPATGSAQMQKVLPPPEFILRITGGRTGTDGAFANRDLDAEVTINGQNAGTQDIYSDGCVFGLDACVYGEPFSVNAEFSAPVGINLTTVPVRIKLIERDDFGDNTVLDLSFNVNNVDGTMTVPGTANGADSWQINFEIAQFTGIPVVAAEPRLCVSVNADFVDDGFGEDFSGAPVPGQSYKAYPAAFAHFSLFVSSPGGKGNTAGYLDPEGCVPPTLIPPSAYAFLADADPTDRDSGALSLWLVVDYRQFKRPDQVTYNVFTLEGVPSLTTYDSLKPGDAPLGTWTKAGVWMIPPARIDLSGNMLSPFSNIAAALGGMLSRDDMGIPPGEYQVVYGQGCAFTDKNTNITIVDSCYSPDDDTLYIGPATRPPSSAACKVDADCPTVQLCFDARGTDACNDTTGCFCGWPDQSRWKYTIVHEAGHQLQARTIGDDAGGDYTFACPNGTSCTGKKSGGPQPDRLVDPPYVDSMSPLCGCQHVGAANSEHCLQSIERTGAAQGEGFAQFFASKAWNKPRVGDCTFVYYKELLQNAPCAAGETCVPFAGGLNSKLPPFGISCEQPLKWRNNHCPISQAAELSTELDWLGFLWGVNTVGDSRASMNDIFAVYRNTCNPLPVPAAGTAGEKCSGEEELGWNTRPPVAQVPASACTATSGGCTGTSVCLNNATHKLCREGNTDCSCQTRAVFGLATGAALYFANDPARLQNLLEKGLTYGVTENLAP